MHPSKKARLVRVQRSAVDEATCQRVTLGSPERVRAGEHAAGTGFATTETDYCRLTRQALITALYTATKKEIAA